MFLFKNDNGYKMTKEEREELKEIQETQAKNANFYGWYDRSLKAKFAIDWETMRVFSIERVVRKHSSGSGCYIDETILGHYKTEGCGKEQQDVISEWRLECSLDEHNRLVESFENYVATKNKRTK